MSKEIIDLLEKARYQVDPKAHIYCQRDINACACIDQALTLLKQQPPAGDFTKEVRNELSKILPLPDSNELKCDICGKGILFSVN